MTDSRPEEEQRAAERLLAGQAWDDYCDTIRLAGHQIEQLGDGLSNLDRAEWYRFLTRLMRNGLERFVENRDPGNPRFRDAPWRCFINLQNPDQDHLMAELPLGSGKDFIIRGERGTVPYFILSTWTAAEPAVPGASSWADQGLEGLEDFNPALLQTGDFIASGDLQYDAEGRFEIVLSPEPGPGNRLRLDEDTTGIIVRVVYEDRTSEQPPRFTLTPAEGRRIQPLEPAALSNNLAKAAQLVLGYTGLVTDWWQSFEPRANQIHFSMERYLSNGGVADREFGFSAWRKEHNEALVVEFTPPDCEYWIFQLCNLWQENLDTYEQGNGYINNRTARLEADGSVRVIIADRDPGVGGNWMDSLSHTQGMMGLRLIQTRGVPVVRCLRGPLEALERDGIQALAHHFEEQEA